MNTNICIFTVMLLLFISLLNSPKNVDFSEMFKTLLEMKVSGLFIMLCLFLFFQDRL